MSDTSTAPLRHGARKLDYIDFLRGIAILGVIFVHTSFHAPELSEAWKTAARFGQFGVQLFFVLSALTLSFSARSRGIKGPERTAFYIRRFFRIAPLYYLGIGIYAWLAMGNVMRGSSWPEYTLLNVGTNILFLHGIFPYGNNSIVPGGWSIGTEMAFYAVFPFVFLFFNSLRRTVIGWFGYIALVLLVIVIVREGIEYNLKISTVVARSLLLEFPVFLAGIGLFHVLRAPDSSRKTWQIGLLIVAGLGCLAGLICTGRHGGNVYEAAMVHALYGGLFAALTAGLSRVKSEWFWRMATPIRWMGKRSFSLYILHFLFTGYVLPHMVEPTLADFNLKGVMAFGVYFLIVCVGASLVAAVSWRLVELPTIRFGEWLAGKVTEPKTPPPSEGEDPVLDEKAGVPGPASRA